jgi:uncharacterized protein YqeY
VSELKKMLADQIKGFMKAQDKINLSFARNLHALIRKKEVDERIDLDDDAVRKIVVSSLKQRNESLEQFSKANREDLAIKEQQEIAYLKTFLPEPLSASALEDIINSVISQVQAKSLQDLGKVLKVLLPQVASQADSGQVSALVKQKLQA